MGSPSLLHEIQGKYNFVEWVDDDLLFVIGEDREEIQLINTKTGTVEKTVQVPGPAITVIDTNKKGNVVLARGAKLLFFWFIVRKKN